MASTRAHTYDWLRRHPSGPTPNAGHGAMAGTVRQVLDVLGRGRGRGDSAMSSQHFGRVQAAWAWGLLVASNLAFFGLPQLLNSSHRTRNILEFIWLAVVACIILIFAMAKIRSGHRHGREILDRNQQSPEER